MKSKRRIAAEYLLLGIACAVVACVSSLWLADREFALRGQLEGRPWNELWPIVGSMWFTLLIHAVLPTGWVFWTGFGFALKKRSSWFYFAAAVPALVAGWLWPHGYQALLSV